MEKLHQMHINPIFW